MHLKRREQNNYCILMGLLQGFPESSVLIPKFNQRLQNLRRWPEEFRRFPKAMLSRKDRISNIHPKCRTILIVIALIFYRYNFAIHINKECCAFFLN